MGRAFDEMLAREFEQSRIAEEAKIKADLTCRIRDRIIKELGRAVDPDVANFYAELAVDELEIYYRTGP